MLFNRIKENSLLLFPHHQNSTSYPSLCSLYQAIDRYLWQWDGKALSPLFSIHFWVWFGIFTASSERRDSDGVISLLYTLVVIFSEELTLKN